MPICVKYNHIIKQNVRTYKAIRLTGVHINNADDDGGGDDDIHQQRVGAGEQRPHSQHYLRLVLLQPAHIFLILLATLDQLGRFRSVSHCLPDNNNIIVLLPPKTGVEIDDNNMIEDVKKIDRTNQ